MLRYLIALLTLAAYLAADPALAIQLRMISSAAGRGLTVEVTDDQGQPVKGAAVIFQLPEKGQVAKAETGADGRATVPSAQLNQTGGVFDLKITAVKDRARAGLIAHQAFAAVAAPAAAVAQSEPVMPVTAAGGDGDFKSEHSFHWKWLAVLGLAAGAGAGLWLKTQSNSAVAISSSPLLAAPQVGTPTITIGHP